VCILRYGLRIDWVNPGIAYVFMFVFGLIHGLWPTLTVSNSLRSLIGAAAPFAFSFSRLSRRWCDAMITAVIWVSPVMVEFGLLLFAVRLRPLFGSLAGVIRLQGSTHPAFLGGFAMTGVYAAVMELYREGRPRNLYALILNFLILGASGARAPLAYALVVT